MKPKLRNLLLAGSALLAISYSQAATLTWDANAATSGQTDGLGAWLNADQWWNGSANTSWTSGDSAIFGNGGAGGAVGLASPTTVGSLAFNYFTGTYTLGTASQTITLNSGIVKNAGAGIVTFSALSPFTLGAAQTFTNNSATNLVLGAVDLNGNALTFGATGNITFEGNSGNVLSGAGGIVKNGRGSLTLDAGAPNPSHTFTGGITINEGRVGFQTAANVSGRGNVTINGGYLGGRFGSSPTFAGGLGTGTTAIQILGGVSGFSGEGGTGSTFTIGTAGSTLKWGASTENGATGFFNPSVLILGGDLGMNTNAKGGLANAIDLNGTTRTITSLHTNGDGATNTGFTVSGAITNSAGTAAGLTKTGPGAVILTANNTYDGETSIQGGSIILSGSGAMNSTTALNLTSGGALRLVNTAQVERLANGADITVSSGGGIDYINTAGANLNYTETVDSATVSGGLFNVNLATNQNNATNNSQTLTLGGLSRSGTGSVAFSAAGTGPQASGGDNMIVVTGVGTTTAGQIVGPWVTTGTAANAQTDYAVYNSDSVVPAAISASAESTWTVDTDPYTMDFTSAGTTLTATRNVGALRVIGGAPLTSVDTATETITLTGHTFVDGNTVVFGTGAPGGLTAGTTYFVVSAATDTFKVSATNGGAAINLTSAGTSPTVVSSTATTLALSTGNNLGTNGILNGSPYAISITPGTGGSVTLPTTSAGNLYINTGSGAITISAPITDNTGALTLVKNGSAGTLILSAANNTYTGNTIINSGTLQVGVSGSPAQLNAGTYAGNIFIARGAALTLQGNSSNTLSGIISGDGNLNLNRGTTTLSGANTYTGKTSITLVATNALGSTVSVSSFNSVVGGTASSSLGAPTTVANGTIEFGGGGIQQSAQINYTGNGETTDRIINFGFNGNNVNRVLDSSGGTNALLRFTSPFTSNGVATNHVVLQGSTNGQIDHGLPFAFNNFTKSGNGTWTLGGAVGNTGTTTISAGTLILNGTKYGAGTVAVNGTSTLGGSGTIAGVVTVAAGANITPGTGTSVGTLTFRNDLNISAMAGGAGVLNMELGPISTSDKIVAGTANIGELAFNDFNFTALGGLQNGTYTLIQSGGITGGLDPDAPDLTGTVGAGTGTLQITGNNVELVVTGIGGGPTGYAAWQTANSTAGTRDQDHDNDGVDNGTEHFLGGDTNTTGFTVLPTVVNNVGILSVTWTRHPNYPGFPGNYGTDVVVETSATLAGPWTPETGGNVTITGNDVKYTFPGGPAYSGKNFARLRVTGP